MNPSQRKLLGSLLPFVAALLLLMLPTKGWDDRPLYFAIFLAILLVGCCEIVLFDLEEMLRHFGRLFIIGFPASVFVIAFFIATSPTIHTRPAYWYPSQPQMQSDALEGLTLALQPRRSAQEYEQYLKEKAEAKAKKEVAYREALQRWEETRALIPPEHSLSLSDPIDRLMAPYWLALLLLVGVIEFRLLAQKSSNG